MASNRPISLGAAIQPESDQQADENESRRDQEHAEAEEKQAEIHAAAAGAERAFADVLEHEAALFGAEGF